MKQDGKSISEKTVHAVHQSIDFITSILLLTGQLTIRGVFFTPSGFSLSLTGPIIGGSRSEAREGEPNVNLVIDSIDVITALLLIIGQINVEGTFITSHLFTIVVSGPPFGRLKTEAYVPEAEEFFSNFKRNVFRKNKVYNFI